MIRIFIIGASLLFSVAALASPGYHDYTQYTHWMGGFLTDGDLVTSVTTCELDGVEHIAVTSRDQGLTLFGYDAGSLQQLGSLALPGTEEGVVFDGTAAYVIAAPARLTKVLAFSSQILVQQWNDTLPQDPLAIDILDHYLLIACGAGGLVIYDTAEAFNLPIGVIAQWGGNVRDVQMVGSTAVVLTDSGVSTLDLADPAAPVELSSFALEDPLVMQVQDHKAYVAVFEDIVELDLSNPADIQHGRTLTDLVDFYGNYPLKALALDETGIYYVAGKTLLHVDLASGQVDWRGLGSLDTRALLVTDGLLSLAGGNLGFHHYARRPPAHAPAVEFATDSPFHTMAEGFLIHSDYTSLVCYDLTGSVPVLAWDYQDGLGTAFKRVFAQGNRLFAADTEARVHLLDYTAMGVTPAGIVDTGGALVNGMGMIGEHLALLCDMTDDGYIDNYLLLYDISDPEAPALLSSLAVNPYSNLLAEGDLAVLWDISNLEAGIRLVNCADPSSPVFGATLDTPVYSRVSRAGDMLYVIDDTTLQALRIVGPNQVDQGPVQAIPEGQYFTAQGNTGYLAGPSLVFDLSDPLAPRAIGSFPIAGTNRTWDAMVDGEYLVAMDAYNFFLLPAHRAALVPADPDALPVVANRQLQAVPNPFNPRVSLQFSLPQAGQVQVDVYDVRGRRVARLGGQYAAGDHAVNWDGVDTQGRAAPSGVYLARVQAPGFEARTKLLLAR